MHKAVLKKEVIECLDPKPNENFIDCTVDGGEHTAAILERIKPKGKILGIDWDKEILTRLKIKNLIPVCGNFADLREIIKKYKFGPINGILIDLGMSSWHLEESGRGFSFLRNEPLDMRYGEGYLTAGKIVNQYPREKIERILREYGEERFSKRIAKKIVEARPVKTTFQLAEVIKKAVPSRLERINPATRTFQALRIAVNDELENLKRVLPQATDILSPGGRLAVISFHSLEDRIVKDFFRGLSSGEFKTLSRKPIRPDLKEIQTNFRSRSAKLRAVKKYGH